MSKKTLKNGMVLLLTLLLTLTLSLPAYAEEGGVCGDDLQWSFSGGTLTITGSGEMTDFPESEMSPWYDLRQQITAVSLPSGLTSVGDLAFYGCEELTAVTLPDSVTRVGDYAFAECAELLTVRLGSGVTEIGECAFRACEKLTAVTLPYSLTTIGSMAFYRCASLAAITVPASVSSMGVSVFAYCTGLVRATLSARLAGVPTWTFYGCSALTEVALSSTISAAGEYAFKGCESIDTVYTDSGDQAVADALLESIRQGDTSFSADSVTTTPPVGSTTTGGSSGTQTTVSENESSTISVKRENDGGKETTTITATITDKQGWSDLKDTVDKARDDGADGVLEVIIQPDSGEISGKDLSRFGGEDATITIRAEDGSRWKIDAANATDKDYSGSYKLGASVTETDSEKAGIESDQVFRVDFADNTDFDVTVGVKVDNARQYATLYQGTDAVQTSVVDDEGYAWFSLASISKRTKYYVGINAEGVGMENAVIPESLSAAYGVDATLTDANGTAYQITGRSSRWGVTGKQFAITAAIIIGSVILVISVVMVTLNKMSKTKAKYAAMAADDDAIDEDDLRMQIMQEMLDEAQKSKKK